MKACSNLWKPNIFQQVGDVMSDIIASPSVRRLAGQKGLDLDQLADDLGRQTIAREDLDASTKHASPRTEQGRQYWEVDHTQYGLVTEEPLSRFAQLTAHNLAAAQAFIPAVTHHDQADISAIEAFRASLKPEAAARGIKLTTLAFHVKTLARLLHTFPRFNASLSVNGETLIFKNYVHIAIAVDTEFGLMVPVIRDVDRKGLWQIAAEISDIAKRAQNRKIRPDEMGGASITITNLGGIGGTAFTPIVNPPEVAILGINRTQIATVWNGSIPVPKPMAPLDLSYDHRVINGAEAARFMVELTRLIADPRRLLT